jgi:hypothetical protein
MGWIVGAIVVWVLWTLMTRKPQREASLKGELSRAFISSTQLGQDSIKTPIYWGDAEKFALDMRAQLINGSYHFQMQISGEEVAVIDSKHQYFTETSK